MRVASRIVGVLLVLAGLSFLILFVFLAAYGFGRQSVLLGPDRSSWIVGSVLMVAGVGFILAGKSFLKLDVDELDGLRQQPGSRFAPFFMAHRRELKVIAQAGLMISLIRLGAACFGGDWPGRWAAWSLVLAFIALAVIHAKIAKYQTGDQLDWRSVPARTRPVVKLTLKAGGGAFVILLVLCGWNAWFHPKAPAQIVPAALIVLLFGREALFFQYGELRADDSNADG